MPTREELVAAFRTFDISGDGLISAQEFTSILMRGDGGLSYGDAQSLISQFDVNGDGQLDVNEFCAMMGSSSAVSTLAGKHAPGIGTAFEFLDEYNNWQLITGADVINQLGKLCAFNTVTQVQYSVGHNNYSVTQQRNGDLVQTNVATGVQRNLRLVPFFFEYEEGPNNWKPVTQPEALTALTAVLASSAEKTYTVYMPGYTGHYTANLLNEQGLIKQQNTQTGKQRRIRATPVGPDGQPHFEFRDGPVGSGVWKPVADSCVKQLAAVAASRGEAFFQITYPEGASERLWAIAERFQPEALATVALPSISEQWPSHCHLIDGPSALPSHSHLGPARRPPSFHSHLPLIHIPLIHTSAPLRRPHFPLQGASRHGRLRHTAERQGGDWQGAPHPPRPVARPRRRHRTRAPRRPHGRLCAASGRGSGGAATRLSGGQVRLRLAPSGCF